LSTVITQVDSSIRRYRARFCKSASFANFKLMTHYCIVGGALFSFFKLGHYRIVGVGALQALRLVNGLRNKCAHKANYEPRMTDLAALGESLRGLG
jgi:hypothetical protein